jgi:hypothetical protein
MKTYDPDLPLFSLHIPKCGGTSLLGALHKWFWRWRVTEHYRGKNEPLPAPTGLIRKMVVHGHFNAGGGRSVLDFYPQAGQFMTFLREPFDRYLSLWHFMPKVAAKNRNPGWIERRGDFETALRRRARLQRAGRNFESFVWHFPQPPNVADIGEQMDRSYVFVGIMERYQESLDALAAVLGKQRIDVAHLNATERESNNYENLRRFYRRHFADEYTVYEAALRRNDALLKRYR